MASRSCTRRPARSCRVAGRELRLALLQQAHALAFAMHRLHRVGEAVVPGADGAADLLFELVHRDVRTGAFAAADDVVNARQHGVVDRRSRGRHPPVQRLGQDHVDALARMGVVAVARHEDEDGDEAVERRKSNGRPPPRRRMPCAMAKRRLARSGTAVARIIVQDMRQRLAVMAWRQVGRARSHDLAGAAAECPAAGGYRRSR